jgi:xyloglucan-specific exo-beta-1,4-glucanase
MGATGGGGAKVSKTNSNRAYHQLPVASGGSNFFRRSDDGGNTWTTKVTGITNIDHQNFYAPFAVDPSNGDRVLYGTDNVWETTNGGDSWTALSSIGVNGWNPSRFNVDAIGLAPSNGNTIYASVNDASNPNPQGHIFVTTNHGAAWTERSIAGNPLVQDLRVDPSNPQIVYAVINQFNPGGTVFRSINGGTSWTNISGNLPNEPAWSLQIGSPNGTLYLGADDGVYVTTNFGTSWSRFGTGSPNAQFFQLELNPSLHVLGAGSHGRGLWTIATP